jgi:cytoskeletal protein CcmA (bactofilin family)
MDTRTATTGDAASDARAGRSRGAEVADTGRALILGAEDQLVGRLVFDGDLHVQGSLEGEATLTGDVSVDAGGVVKARLEARSMVVRGTVEGDAAVHDRLLIAGSGSITGDVTVGRLVIEDGAVLNGSVTMERVVVNGAPIGPRSGPGGRRQLS